MKLKRIVFLICVSGLFLGRPASAQGVVGQCPASSAAPQPGATIEIHDIKGAGAVSPFVNQSVTDIHGIVTALTVDGFFMQESDDEKDSNDCSSEGIFVATKNAPKEVQVMTLGNEVLISGTILETYAGPPDSIEIMAQSGKRLNIGTPFPFQIIIGKGGRIPPVNGATQPSAANLFDPQNNPNDFYHTLDGMRVMIKDASVIGATDANGDTIISTSDNTQKIVLSMDAYHKMFPADKPVSFKVGDKFSVPIVGVLFFRDGAFRVTPVSHPLKVA